MRRFYDDGGGGLGGGGEHHLHKLPVGIMLTFGACSGLVAQTVTYPLDVVRRQMQVCQTAVPSQKALLNVLLFGGLQQWV